MKESKWLKVGFLASVSLLFVHSQVAWGWLPSTHRPYALYSLQDTAQGQALLNAHGIDQSINGIWKYADDLDDEPWKSTYHANSWNKIQNRDYVFNSAWADITNKTQRFAFIHHMAFDCGVPCNHSPASEHFTDDAPLIFNIEEHLEARADRWNYSPPSTYYFSFGHDHLIETFHAQMCSDDGRSNWGIAKWAKNNVANWIEAESGADGRTAAWNGLKAGQALAYAVCVDHLLSQEPTYAEVSSNRITFPGRNLHFYTDQCRDPDSIVINPDGSWFNDGGGITEYAWDFTSDGTFDFITTSPHLDMTYEDAMWWFGVGPDDEGFNLFHVTLRVRDNEGDIFDPSLNNHGYAYDTCLVNVIGPAGFSLTPEPSSMLLIASGLFAGVWRPRRRRQG